MRSPKCQPLLERRRRFKLAPSHQDSLLGQELRYFSGSKANSPPPQSRDCQPDPAGDDLSPKKNGATCRFVIDTLLFLFARLHLNREVGDARMGLQPCHSNVVGLLILTGIPRTKDDPVIEARDVALFRDSRNINKGVAQLSSDTGIGKHEVLMQVDVEPPAQAC